MSDRQTKLKFTRVDQGASSCPSYDIDLVSAAGPNDASKMFKMRWTGINRISLAQVDTERTIATAMDHGSGWKAYIYHGEFHAKEMNFAREEYDLIFLHPEFTYLITSDPGPEYGR
jgi:hypothetical protein